MSARSRTMCSHRCSLALPIFDVMNYPCKVFSPFCRDNLLALRLWPAPCAFKPEQEGQALNRHTKQLLLDIVSCLISFQGTGP